MEAAQVISIRNKMVGILVRRARREAGKSKRDCAKFIGCSPATFSKYERGQKGLSLPEVEALAYFLEVSPASLWDDAYAPPQDSLQGHLPMEQMMILRRKILAVQLRKCREAIGFTQDEMAERLGCSVHALSQYEQGQADISLGELEMAAETCGRSLSDFADDQTIPLGRAERERRALARLDELPPELREFVLNPTNRLYIDIARRISALKADSLRQIAETLLEITY